MLSLTVCRFLRPADTKNLRESVVLDKVYFGGQVWLVDCWCPLNSKDASDVRNITCENCGRIHRDQSPVCVSCLFRLNFALFSLKVSVAVCCFWRFVLEHGLFCAQT